MPKLYSSKERFLLVFFLVLSICVRGKNRQREGKKLRRDQINYGNFYSSIKLHTFAKLSNLPLRYGSFFLQYS